MPLIIASIFLFISAAVIANILQSILKYRYESKPLIFIALFLVCIGSVSFFVNIVPTLLLQLPVLLIALMYIIIIICLAKYGQSMQSLYGAKSVSDGYEGLIRPKLQGQVVKVFEIVLQDISAWLIVGGLFLPR